MKKISVKKSPDAIRQARRKDTLEAIGLVKRSVWVPGDRADELAEIARHWRVGAGKPLKEDLP